MLVVVKTSRSKYPLVLEILKIERTLELPLRNLLFRSVLKVELSIVSPSGGPHLVSISELDAVVSATATFF